MLFKKCCFNVCLLFASKKTDVTVARLRPTGANSFLKDFDKVLRCIKRRTLCEKCPNKELFLVRIWILFTQ